MSVAYNQQRLKVTSNQALEITSKINRLDSFITCPAEKDFVSQKKLTATIEAIVGAVYLDGGMDAAETVVQNLGINALEGAVPRASFNLRTRGPYARRSSVKPSNVSQRKKRKGR